MAREKWEVRGHRGHWTVMCDGQIIEDMFNVTKREATENMRQRRESLTLLREQQELLEQEAVR